MNQSVVKSDVEISEIWLRFRRDAIEFVDSLVSSWLSLNMPVIIWNIYFLFFMYTSIKH